MNERIEQTTNKLIQSLELPQDLFLGLPGILLTGNRRISVSNHKGILLYEEYQIVILTKQGELRITGQNLIMEHYSKQELIISGYIRQLEFL